MKYILSKNELIEYIKTGKIVAPVHCKDCKYCKKNKRHMFCMHWNSKVRTNDYCSYGENK